MKGNSYVVWKLLLFSVACLVLIPVLVVFIDTRDFDIQLFSFLRKQVFPRYFRNTLFILVLVLSSVIFLGSVIAWLCAMYRFPARTCIIFLQVFPLLVPSYIGAITWRNAFSYDGFMTHVFGATTLLGKTMASLPSFVVLIFVLACNVYPFIFLVQYIFFTKFPQSLIDSAKIMNKKRSNLFITLGIPLSFTSIMSVSLLVAMELINEQWTYQYLGYEIISTGIVRVLLFYQNMSIAKILSLIVVVCMIFLLLCKNYIEKKQHAFHTMKAMQVRVTQLPVTTGIFVMVCCLVPVMLGFVIPVIQLFVWAAPVLFSPFIIAKVVPPLLNTVLLCILVVCIQIPLSVLLSYASRLTRKGIYKTSFSLISIGYAVPSVVIVILILSIIHWIDTLFPSVAVFTLFVSRGIYALVFACVYRYIPIALAPINVGFHTANVRYEEASRSMGISPIKTLWKICLPINKGFIFTATMLTIIEMIKDIPIANILRPYNFETLAIKVYNLVNNEQLAEASVVALVLVGLGIIVSLPVYGGLMKQRRV